MRSYRGFRLPGGCRVEWSDDGRTWHPLRPRNDLRNHSPDGFEWGYGGSGPAQLALALLADMLPRQEALSLYQSFKRAIVSRLDRNSWEMHRKDIWTWIEAQRAAGAADAHA